MAQDTRSVCGVARAVSWAFWLLFTGVLVWCVLCCVCGVLGPQVRVHRCVCSLCCGVCGVNCGDTRVRCFLLFVWCPGPLGSCLPVCSCALCCVACVASWDPWFVFTGVFVLCVAVCVVSPVVTLVFVVLYCLCGVLGHLAPVQRCARSVCGVACLVCWASWLLFTGAHARCLVLPVWCPGPLGSCSPVRTLHSPQKSTSLEKNPSQTFNFQLFFSDF